MRIELYPGSKIIPFGPCNGHDVANQFKTLEFDLNDGLQGVVRMAAEVCGAPIAFITLMDDEDWQMKVRKGVEVASIPLCLSFCALTGTDKNVVVIEDARNDARFAGSQYVIDAPGIRFYAGAPIIAEGRMIGSLCVLDTRPGVFSENKKQLLEILARQALHLMQLQLGAEVLRKQAAEIELQNKALAKIAQVHSHELRAPVASIMGLMNIIKDEGYSNSGEYFLMMEEVVKSLDDKIRLVVATTVHKHGQYTA